MRTFTIIIVTTVLTTIFTTIMIWAIENTKMEEYKELNKNLMEYYKATEEVLDTIAKDNSSYYFDNLVERDVYQNYVSIKEKITK